MKSQSTPMWKTWWNPAPHFWSQETQRWQTSSKINLFQLLWPTGYIQGLQQKIANCGILDYFGPIHSKIMEEMTTQCAVCSWKMKASTITLNDPLLREFCLPLPSPAKGWTLDKGLLISCILLPIPISSSACVHLPCTAKSSPGWSRKFRL